MGFDPTFINLTSRLPQKLNCTLYHAFIFKVFQTSSCHYIFTPMEERTQLFSDMGSKLID
jgi:hypothetical protein